VIKYIFMLAALSLSTAAEAKIKVVTSTSDLAYFAAQIGGDLIEVEAIASPKADIHFVEIRPSYMTKVAAADVAFKIGLELDMWMDRIIDGSHNGRLIVADCSKYIEPLEVPTFKADARHGDLHRFGNPHYWLGPQNVKPITEAIVEGLTKADPQHEARFRENQQAFLAEIDRGLEALAAKRERLRGKEVVFYHNSWPYFNAYTGLIAAGFIEPFPGVSPSPSHLKKITELVQERHIPIIAVEPYFDKRAPDKIASVTGAKVVTVYPSIGGRQAGESYLQWLEGNLDALLEVIP